MSGTEFMRNPISLRCSCGKVRGIAKDVTPARGNRVVCYCDDCQAYAHWLGRADDMLDAHGGTDVYQLTPAQLEITDGAEYVRCMRLTAKGLLRWYTACCRTPVANQVDSIRIPFAGIPQPFMDHAGDGCTREQAVGPVIVRVHVRYAKTPPAEKAHPKVPVWYILRVMGQLFRGSVRGAHLPSPFVDARTKSLIRTPEILSAEERERLRASSRCVP